jgi:hypothetical protein
LIWSITQPTHAILISFLTPEDSWSSTNPTCYTSFSWSVSHLIRSSQSICCHSFQELRDICSLPLHTVPDSSTVHETDRHHKHTRTLISFQGNNTGTQESKWLHLVQPSLSKGICASSCDFSGFTDWLPHCICICICMRKVSELQIDHETKLAQPLAISNQRRQHT